jgi:hypothetical protein
MLKVTPSTQVLTLEVQGGPHQGSSKTIDSTQSLRIGTEDCDLDLPACASAGIRAEHGKVLYKNGSWIYTSIDGEAFMNDKDILEGESCSIGSGFIMMLGDDVEIKVTIIANKSSTPEKSGSASKRKGVTLEPPTEMKVTFSGGGNLGLKCEVQYPHCLVTKVTPGSAADKANILYSDTIVSVNGKTVGSDSEMSSWENIKYYIENSFNENVELVILRAVSPKVVIDALKSEVNANLEKVRTVFGAESIDYKKTTAQAIIETDELDRMEKIPFLRNPDDEFVRLPYNPKNSNNFIHYLTFPEPRNKRKDRTKTFIVTAEDVKELKLGLNAKFKPRHCYIKSCSSALKAKGLKPGGVVRAVDMVRCPPSGGPKQEGNARDMAEAVIRERTMDGREITLSVEYPNYVSDCARWCCPLTWVKEVVTNKPLHYSRMQNLDDCLCCCNCCCNVLNEDCNCCHRPRKLCCSACCLDLIPKLTVCCPLMCVCSMSGLNVWN